MDHNIAAKRKRRNSALLLAAAAALLPRTGRSAITDDWTATGTANWNTAGNWSGDQVPQGNDTVNIGISNAATFSVSYNYNGANVTLGALTLNMKIASGTAAFNMAGNTLVSPSENIGDSGSGSSGGGIVNQSGGTNQLPGSLSLGVNASDKGFYNLSGTGLLVTPGGLGPQELVGVDGAGVFNQSGGSNDIVAYGNTLFLGENSGSTGTYIFSAGTLSAAGLEFIGNGGTGIFNQSGGSNTLMGGGGANQLILGQNSGSTGSYALSGTGSIFISGPSQEQEIVGAAGTGNFIQTGGNNTVGNSGSGIFSIAAYGGSTGSYTLSGGVLTVNGDAGVGGTAFGDQAGGTGTLAVSSTGQMVVAGLMDIFTGGAVTTTDEVVGGGSADGATIVVGSGADNGAIVQSGGTNTLGNGMTLGLLEGTTGTYLQSGSGSILSCTGSEILGFEGVGIFNQTGGTNTVGSALYLAFENSATGEYLLSGGALTVDGNAYIGYSNAGTGGTGVLTVSNNGQMTVTNTLTIYQFSTVTAVNEYVGGAGITNGMIAVGPVGDNGTIVQGAGVNVISTNLELALTPGTTGTYMLSNTGSLSVNFSIFVGAYGVGVFNQSGGTNTVLESVPFSFGLGLGYGTGSTGTYILSSSGVLSVAGNEWLGGNDSTSGGNGIFNQSGGTNTLTNDGDLDLGIGSSATGTYVLSGTGSLLVSDAETVGDYGAGVFNQSGGSNHVDDFFYIAGQTGSTGSYTLSGGLLSGGLFEYVGEAGSGNFNQTGGVNEAVTLNLGENVGATGTYVLSSGGSLSAENENVGNSGTGIFNQSGGQNDVGSDFSDLMLGVNGNSAGTYNLSGTGTVAVIGLDSYEYVGYGGAGVFNQSGGVNTTGSVLFIAYNSGSTGNYTLSGGVLSAPNIYVGGGTTAAGGTGVFTVSQTGLLSLSGTLQVWNNGRANLDVPLTNVGKLAITGNGIVNLNGTLNINYGSPPNDPITSIVSYLKNGYHAGAWTGTSGIISTSVAAGGPTPILSVGYADGNTDNGTPAGPNQIVVQYTMAGDANLDGHVNSADLLAVIQNFNKTGTDWSRGDFTYISSGQSTTSADLLLVIQNFNQTLPPPAGSAVNIGGTTIPLGEAAGVQIDPTAVRVPEPGALSVALVAGAGYLARRKRHLRTRN